MQQKPPRMAIKHNISNSRLLITFLHRAHKHQLSDFFDTYACDRQLTLTSGARK